MADPAHGQQLGFGPIDHSGDMDQSTGIGVHGRLRQCGVSGFIVRAGS
jgi:hypothetical protein